MIKTLHTLGASLLLAIALNSCTVTPEQAAQLEMLREVIEIAITVQK